MVSSGRVLIDDNSLLLLATWFHVSHVCCCNLWHFRNLFSSFISVVFVTPRRKQMGNKKKGNQNMERFYLKPKGVMLLL